MRIDELLPRLEGVKRSSRGFVARCPAHPDRNPSLSVNEGERAILVRCWAGCRFEQIVSALALQASDLFSDSLYTNGRPRSFPSPQVDRRALAFRNELYALDLQLRAQCVLDRVTQVSAPDDAVLDRVLNVLALAYADCERAQLFEHLADTLRVKEWHSRQEKECRAA
jgi:hypothetical protein